MNQSRLLNRMWHRFYFNKTFVAKAGSPALEKEIKNETELLNIDVKSHFDNIQWDQMGVNMFYRDQRERVHILQDIKKDQQN